MSDIKKAVLAYSGGLDTSVILKWLQDTYQCEVVTFTAEALTWPGTTMWQPFNDDPQDGLSAVVQMTWRPIVSFDVGICHHSYTTYMFLR